MSNGDGINNKPLLIKHLLELPKGFSNSLKIKHCPIYGFYFAYYNLSITSYGCTTILSVLQFIWKPNLLSMQGLVVGSHCPWIGSQVLVLNTSI